MPNLHGSTSGLKRKQVDRLEKLYRRRVDPSSYVSPELATTMAELSAELNRQIGVFIDRKGHLTNVMIGDAGRVYLPDVGRHRAGSGRLRGVRLVHTELKGEGLTRDDLTDLALLKLDTVISVQATAEGRPAMVEVGHVLPDNVDGQLWEKRRFKTVFDAVGDDFLAIVSALEEELARSDRLLDAGPGERAMLVQVRSGKSRASERSLAELKELCRTAGVSVVDVITQRRPKQDPKFVVGRGKLEDVILRSMQLNAETVIFDHDLSPAQVRAIGDMTEVKIVDRTQLILDIFAQHAKSRAGKLQVELAQLKYMLPRLAGRYTRLSRQGGGLASRGPGEKQLETDRRRMRQRIHRLDGEIKKLGKQRAQRRALRKSRKVPVVAIVGYTNAGKSTLLNTLTRSDVLAENKLFATLDPTTRRLRFPMERELVLADTVGFIHDLPEELVSAFRATLEELSDADLLLHVVDGADPDLDAQIDDVLRILDDLNFGAMPRLLVLNKQDLLPDDEVGMRAFARGAVAISALDRASCLPVLERMEKLLWQEGIDVPDPPGAVVDVS